MSKIEGELTGTFFMMGNHAIVEGAIAAGCRYFAGYPITPASEISERMAERLPQVGGRFIQMEDEIGSIFSVIGASLAGVKSMTATASAGYNYMLEGIGYAVAIEAPCVIVDVQRTRQDIQPTDSDVMQPKWGTSGDYEIICLMPSTVQESFDLMIDAFNFSEKYRNPVVVLCDGVTNHMRGKLTIPDYSEIEKIDRKRPSLPSEEYLPFRADEDGVPPMADLGKGYRVLYSVNPHDEKGRILWDPDVYEDMYNRICGKITRAIDDFSRYEFAFLEDADVAVVSYGSESRSALDAVTKARKEGIRAGSLKLTTIWPVPSKILEALSERVKKIIVPEMNSGKYVNEVERICSCKAQVIAMPKNRGEMHTSQEILKGIRSVAK